MDKPQIATALNRLFRQQVCQSPLSQAVTAIGSADKHPSMA